MNENRIIANNGSSIAAMFFLWFMEKNGILYSANVRKRIADNNLAALTLMIAEKP